MRDWLVFSMITLLLWGFWAFLVKVALHVIDWKTYFIISSIATIIALPLVFFYYKPQISVHNMGFWYALLAGSTGVIATIIYYLAISRGKASIVVPLTALYPLVTIIASFIILKEEVTIFQGVGIVLALCSIVFISL